MKYKKMSAESHHAKQNDNVTAYVLKDVTRAVWCLIRKMADNNKVSSGAFCK